MRSVRPRSPAHGITFVAAAHAGAAALAIAGLTSWPVAAAPCARPDLVDAFPPADAALVPTDASLYAHYALTAVYAGEPVELMQVGVGTEVVPARFDATERLLTVTPPRGLAPGGEYVIRWPELRGSNTVERGLARDVRFTVGEGPDLGPPVFGGVRDIAWDLDSAHDDCTDSRALRYVVDLDLEPAMDDGGRDSLALVIFQTAGPRVEGAPRPVHVGPVPGLDGASRARVRLAIGEGVGHVCFAAIVRDLRGNVSGGGNREVCVETIEPPFFVGCAVVPVGAPPVAFAWVLGIGFLVHRRRSRGR